LAIKTNLKTITCRVLFGDSISAFDLLTRLVADELISNFRALSNRSACDSNYKYTCSFKCK